VARAWADRAVRGVDVQPVDLRVDHTVNPLGVACARPHLSWRLLGQGRGERQVAYRVEVARDARRLARGRADLWDSGRVVDDAIDGVPYHGLALKAGETAHWRVTVWADGGRAATSAESAWWEAALLQPQDWQGARWIGAPTGAPWPDLYAAETVRLDEAEWLWAGGWATTVLSRVWDLPCGHIGQADFSFAATGRASVMVNGRSLGETLAPRQFHSVRVTGALRAGANHLAVVAHHHGPGPAAVIGRLAAVCVHGHAFILPLDRAWSAAGNHPVRRVAMFGSQPAWALAQPAADRRRLPAVMLLRTFRVTGEVIRARAYVCGLGYGRATLNGQPVGNEWQDPPISPYDRHVFYRVHDVSGHVRAGDNAFGLVLVGGRYYPPRMVVPTATKVYGYPRALVLIVVDTEESGGVRHRQVVVSDGAWHASVDGPLQAASEYDGEDYDATRAPVGWDEPGFDAARWAPAALMDPPAGRLRVAQAEPMRPVAMRLGQLVATGSGERVYDFGQNFYGTAQLAVAGERGTEVRVRFAQALSPDGRLDTANQRSAENCDRFVLAGVGEEILSTQFVGRGFRYAAVSSSGPLAQQRVSALVIRSDLETVGHFACTHDLLNRIHESVRWGQQSILRSVPMESDRDERQGWMGDPAKGAEGQSYNFDVRRLYRKWLADVRAEQTQDGRLPDGAPKYFQHWFSDDMVWPSVMTIVPMWAYRCYGDRRFIADNYESAARWFVNLHGRGQNRDGTMNHAVYGDWCDALGEDDRGGTDPALIASAYAFLNARLLAAMARVLHRGREAEQFDQLAHHVQQGYQARFLDRAGVEPRFRTQCALVLPLAFGMVDHGPAQELAAELGRDIRSRGNHLSVGLVGMQWMMRVLARHGLADLAYHVATSRTAPSWGYMIEHGATTIWERWNSDVAPPAMNSLNLLILAGNLTSWLYEDVAGLSYHPSAPGGRHVWFTPRPLADLGGARAAHRSSYGWSRAEWRREGDHLYVSVSLPAHAEATVVLPTTSMAAVRMDQRPLPWWAARGVQVREQPGAAVKCHIGSGDYTFQVVGPFPPAAVLGEDPPRDVV